MLFLGCWSSKNKLYQNCRNCQNCQYSNKQNCINIQYKVKNVCLCFFCKSHNFIKVIFAHFLLLMGWNVYIYFMNSKLQNKNPCYAKCLHLLIISGIDSYVHEQWTHFYNFFHINNLLRTCFAYLCIMLCWENRFAWFKNMWCLLKPRGRI